MNFSSFDPHLVGPLGRVENRFLSVLLTEFSLRRREADRGAELTVHFDEHTPAIWRTEAKFAVQREIPDFASQAKRYQQELDAFLLEGQGSEYHFDDPRFPFRYAGGGTLPILRMGTQEYVCLFFRDIYPVGWNIANGGFDNVHEMRNPVYAIEREFCEELIVLDPNRSQRYVFEWDAGKELDRPEFAVARRIWHEQFPDLDVPSFQEVTIPLKWFGGPDALCVHYGKEPAGRVVDCFLNINGRDFGIEVDRVAKINVEESVRLCDGEIRDRHLLNRIVGLFPPETLSADAVRQGTRFLPEKFFFSGKVYEDPGELDAVIDGEFREHVQQFRSEEELRSLAACDKRYNLCPVTRSILLRYLAWQARLAKRPPQESCDVFLSFEHNDVLFARQVHDFLVKQLGKRVFFSEECHDVDYSRAIDQALDAAGWLIAVGTVPQHLGRPWPEYEWRSFHLDILAGHKPAGRLLSFISFDPDELPRPLHCKRAIRFDPDNLNRALKELGKCVH